jgi:hypothetical protein
MIQTTTEVSYDIRDLNKKAIKFAEIVQVIRVPKDKKYHIIIEEWVEIEGLKQHLTTKSVGMSYEESNTLTDYLDANFEITETKTERRDRYTILGHLVTNNNDQVCNTNWELREILTNK